MTIREKRYGVRDGRWLIAALLAASCGAPPATQPPPAPAPALAPPPSALPSPAPAASAEPSKPAEPSPRVGMAAAREAAEAAFRRLQPAIGSTVKLEASDGGPTCADGACAWRWGVVFDAESFVGTIEVDGDTGAARFVPNDGRSEPIAIDAFLARDAERQKAIRSVEALPVVKAYCKRVVAQKLGCLVYFEDDPSDKACGASPALESSCWMTVYVGEAHATHASRFATFLVAPGTFRVVGASGFCQIVPLAQFSARPNGDCPE
jgi:hypothetical protein